MFSNCYVHLGFVSILLPQVKQVHTLVTWKTNHIIYTGSMTSWRNSLKVCTNPETFPYFLKVNISSKISTNLVEGADSGIVGKWEEVWKLSRVYRKDYGHSNGYRPGKGTRVTIPGNYGSLRIKPLQVFWYVKCFIS